MNLPELQGLQDRLTVDTSEARPVFLLRGRGGSYLRLSSSAYHLLRLLSEGHSCEEIARALGEKQTRPVTPTEVEQACRSVLERIERIDSQGPRLPFGNWLTFPLVPATLVRRVAVLLSGAFHPQVATVLLGLCAVVALLLGTQISPQITLDSFWQGYLLFFVSLFAHEFGHASACARYGVQPDGIGFTLYLIYPSFYSDVSAAWQLKRWQRVVVDAGGIYFQLLVGAAFAIAYKLSGWEPLHHALLMLLTSCLFSLNPIFRFDGYWGIADALGVTNLSKQPRYFVGYLAARLRGQPTPELPWPPSVVGWLGLYTVVSLAVWAYFLSRILPAAGHYVWEYPSMVAECVRNLLQGSQPLMKTLQPFLVSTFILIVTLLMVQRLTRSLLIPAVQWLSRRWKSEAAPTPPPVA
jgi:putative peptide zinc metalloprotease protein